MYIYICIIIHTCISYHQYTYVTIILYLCRKESHRKFGICKIRITHGSWISKETSHTANWKRKNPPWFTWMSHSTVFKKTRGTNSIVGPHLYQNILLLKFTVDHFDDTHECGKTHRPQTWNATQCNTLQHPIKETYKTPIKETCKTSRIANANAQQLKIKKPPLVKGVHGHKEKRKLESDFECDETFEPDRPATAHMHM